MYVTLDGYFEGPNKELDWFVWDDKMAKYSIDLLNTVDAILFGRVTYQLMAGYWPTPSAASEDPVITEKMNSLPKIVFSKTLEKVGWSNTRLVKGDVEGELSQLKQQPGKDMVIFGSSDLAASLTQFGLIDEYRIIVNPVVLGSGKPFLKGINGKLNLKLVKTKAFSSGNVILFYQPENKK
jgi:dihydrofolate reductase